MSTRPEYDDRRDIEDLIVRYAHTIDRGDLEGFADLFTHGTWLGRQGRNETLAWVRDNVRLYDGQTWTQHLVSSVLIEMSDTTADRAHAISRIHVVQQPPGEEIRTVRVNVYEDTFVRVEGTWWFATREVTRRLHGDDSAHLL